MPSWELRPIGVAFALGLIGAGQRAEAAKPDLSPYIGNTIACAAGVDGHDLCHTWLYPHGRMINFDQMGGHPGHYTLSPLRADGTWSICYYYDNALIPVPAAFVPQMPARLPGATGGPGPVKTVCNMADFRSTCQRIPLAPGETAVPMNIGMGQRFHDGLCYPMPARMKAGDSMVVLNDPLPSQGGKDVLMLLQGRR